MVWFASYNYFNDEEILQSCSSGILNIQDVIPVHTRMLLFLHDNLLSPEESYPIER